MNRINKDGSFQGRPFSSHAKKRSSLPRRLPICLVVDITTSVKISLSKRQRRFWFIALGKVIESLIQK
jgi:hypothetical protein